MMPEYTSASVAKDRLQKIIMQDRAKVMTGGAGDDVVTCMMIGIYRARQIDESHSWMSALVVKRRPVFKRIMVACDEAFTRGILFALRRLERAMYRAAEGIDALGRLADDAQTRIRTKERP